MKKFLLFAVSMFIISNVVFSDMVSDFKNRLEACGTDTQRATNQIMTIILREQKKGLDPCNNVELIELLRGGQCNCKRVLHYFNQGRE